MKGELAALVIVLTLILGVAAGYFTGVSTARSSLSTSTVTAYTSTVQASVLNSGVYLMKVNGSWFWADDVSKETKIQNPGYGYFLNGSITFDGVRFTTICPTIYSSCPNPSGVIVQNQITVLAGAIRFNMTLPDGRNETLGGVIGDAFYLPVLANQAPRAGMLIEYVNDYPHNTVAYGVFLLVSSCTAPPFLC